MTMPRSMPCTDGFRARLQAGDVMMGTFLKTPSSIVCEVLGFTPLACVCIDAEHAPFGRVELDGCIAAFRAADMPCLVRVQTANAGEILTALDSGATGVVFPHVITGAQAATMAQAARYADNTSNYNGTRGYAASSRSARYTNTTMAQHIAHSNQTVVAIAQIEDAQALKHLDDIAATVGIDCLFVGRMDLTVSLGAASATDPIVMAAVEQICAAGKRHGKPVGMFFPATETCSFWQAKGATFFMLASDQQFIQDGAKALVERLKL